MNSDNPVSILQMENESLRQENQKLYEQNQTKDNYITKLEEKIGCMEKYVLELEKENQEKTELYKNISNTKFEFEKLKKNWFEKYQKLQEKYSKLKTKYEKEKNQIPQRDNARIDKCISNINNVIATFNNK